MSVRRFRLRESTLTHLVTALGILLVGAALASGPLGRSPDSQTQGHLAVASVAQIATATPARPAAAENNVSSRGGRPTDSPATVSGETATPAGAAQPTPTVTAPSIPTPPAPAKGAPTQRVGIQAGHWKEAELPAELASLRGSTGAAGTGWREVDINLDIARRVAALLEQANVIVDLIPSTVPVQYKADAFVALHGDANSNTSLSGYKLARSSRSSIPAKDDALLNALSSDYAAATGLPFHAGTITVNMTAYYAFANRGIQHSIAPTTPGVILEMGFLTTTKDRNLLMQQPDLVAGGIAKGILKFLGR